MAAEVLASNGVRVVVRDHMAAPARKLLLAGRGGLNITHSEDLDRFLDRYGPERERLEPLIRAFPPEALVAWVQGLGIETFVGSSGRVFPRTMKASPLLRAWLRRLAGQGVKLETRTAWTGFDEPCGILALGGASWPALGSNAAWVPAFRAAGIEVNDFQPSNGRVRVKWSQHFIRRHAGAAIKNVTLSYAGHSARGEIVISRDGLEGGAIYALSRVIRENPGQRLSLDLKPDLTALAATERMSKPRNKQSRSNFLRKSMNLSPPAIALMAETGGNDPKSVDIELLGFVGIERAISSAGGVSWQAVDENLGLLAKPGWHVAGEMLDWEAPTGGYLLQACFATGAAAARGLLQRLGKLPLERHIHKA
jgi:hypothetical protein